MKSIPKTNYSSIDEYISSLPVNVATIMQKIRRIITKAAPDTTEAISYQMPTFKLKGKNLVHFAAWRDHIGFYPTPSGTKKFERELKKYKYAKGSVRFPLDKPIPYSLISKIVTFRKNEESLK